MHFRTCISRWSIRLGAAALACLAAGPSLAQTPTLGELAKQEQERRRAITTPGRVITDKDLPKRSTPPAPAPQQLPPAQPAAAAADAKAQKAEKPKAEPEQDEAWWRARIDKVREDLRRNELFAEALQSRINALTTDFHKRDDPYQRALIAQDRREALNELERVKADIAAATRQIADIEEEARQAGVPPGWIR